MQSWEQALEKFLADWKNKDYVLGAMATGSYVTGHATKYSDVDVHIILSDKINSGHSVLGFQTKRLKWRERGNKIVDGFLIEYFANPVRRLREYQKEDYEENSRTGARMFCTGKIIFDKTGIVARLKAEAEKEMARKFKKPEKIWVESAKYKLWDHFDTLKDLHDRKAPTFEYIYYLSLESLIGIYSKFLRAEVPPPFKLHALLNDAGFRRDYRFEEFPDKDFSNLLLKCLTERDRNTMLENMEKSTNYVLEKMGGFNIDGWKLRTTVK